jgi:hypothetical protein
MFIVIVEQGNPKTNLFTKLKVKKDLKRKASDFFSKR